MIWIHVHYQCEGRQRVIERRFDAEERISIRLININCLNYERPYFNSYYLFFDIR